MRKITMLSILLAMAFFVLSSCAPTVSQQEYDRVSDELSAIQGQMASLQSKRAEAELMKVQYEELNKQLGTKLETAQAEYENLSAEYEKLSTEYEELNKRFDTVKGESETVQASYEELSTRHEELNRQFEELSEQYDIIIQGTAEIDEKDIEQAVFQLVNQGRKDNGLNELLWGDNLYRWATANSRNMAINKRIEYSELFAWQEIFWATGYGTADMVARAAMTIWKDGTQYERNFLSPGANYGAVAVYKSGEIFYITYIADFFR